MEELIKFIIGTLKILMKKKDYIIMGIIVPIFIIIFFSFEFSTEYNFRIGVIDKDNTYVSREMIQSMDEIEDVDIVNIKEEDYKIFLITNQIQMAILIDDDFQEKLLNLEDGEIHIKSIAENDMKSIMESFIKSKVDDMITLSKLSDKDINKFKILNQDYKDQYTVLSLNDVNSKGPEVNKSFGLIMLTTFIVGGIIIRLFIDEENNKKIRKLSIGMSKLKYYLSMIIVFYTMSAMTSIIYYSICKLFNINFMMSNTINFLVMLLLLNLLSVSFNLCMSSFIKSRYVLIINILILMPCLMLSGVFWSFYIMPQNLQIIGEVLPTRWVYLCVEILQKKDSLVYTVDYIYMIICVSMALFILSIIKFKLSKRYKKITF